MKLSMLGCWTELCDGELEATIPGLLLLTNV